MVITTILLRTIMSFLQLNICAKVQLPSETYKEFGPRIYEMANHTNRISFKNPSLSDDQLQSEQLILARRGKGVYRFRVEQVEFQCRLTEVTNKEYLAARHIKPWRNCTNEEKLDGNNGFLMCPHIGYLFDKGLIVLLIMGI